MVLFHKIKRSELRVGDHIYTYRTAFAYAHHGIYIGGNNVIHFTSADGHKKLIPRSSMCASHGDCGFRQTQSLVERVCLNCFLKDGDLRRFEYGVSEVMYLANLRGGSCTTAISDVPDTVVHRASYLLCNGFGSYSLFKNNCEDFSLYCKTGLKIVEQTHSGSSGQVYSTAVSARNSFFGVALIAIASAAIMVPLPSNQMVIGRLAHTGSAGGGFFRNRLNKDIGYRKDVVKVSVEDLADTM